MELFENKVGRPSNEIIKKRRMFIASMVLIAVVVLFAGCYALFSIGTNMLMGAANGNSKIYHTASKKDVTLDNNCYINIQVAIENRTNDTIKVTKAKITKNGNTNGTLYASINHSATIAKGKGKKAILTYKFPITKIPSSAKSLGLVTYFKIGSKEYYKIESVNLSSEVRNKIKTCTTAPKNGNTKINHYTDKGDVSVDGSCKLNVQVDVENRTTGAINITSAKITKNGDTNGTKYASVNYSAKLSGKGKKAILTYKFPVTKIPEGASSLGLVTYFNDGKANYYKIESINLSTDVKNKIKNCKATGKPNTSATTKTPTGAATKKSTNLSCTVTNSTTGSGNISCTTVAGATVEVLGQSPVTFMKSFTADSKGKVSVSVPKEGSYLVQATKSGYTSTKQTIKVNKSDEYYSSSGNGYINSVTKNGLTLTCPSQVIVNEEFRCRTNLVGAKISATTTGLKKGLNSSYTTTKSDRTKYLIYTSKGGPKVTATFGNTSVSLYIAVQSLSGDDFAGQLQVDCPSEAYVNELFVCATSKIGAKISIPSANLNRNTVKALSHIANAGSRIKLLKYTKAGNVTVTFTADGQKVTKTIKIKNK